MLNDKNKNAQNGNKLKMIQNEQIDDDDDCVTVFHLYMLKSMCAFDSFNTKEKKK